MKTHVEGVISNLTVLCSGLQMVHFENSFSFCAVEPYQALVTVPGKTKGSYAFIEERQFPARTQTHTHVDALAHVELKCHYLAGMEELNNTEQTGKERKRETKMVLNSFIIQMNENHINASRQGRASVSKLDSPIM